MQEKGNTTSQKEGKGGSKESTGCLMGYTEAIGLQLNQHC